MEKRTNLDYDLMAKKVRIITTEGEEIICIVDEYTSPPNSDRYPIPFVFITTDKGKKSFIYEDEIESIEIIGNWNDT